MTTSRTSLAEFVAQGAGCFDVVEYLTARERPAELTFFRFLLILQEELGIPFGETRKLGVYFKPDWTPMADVELIDRFGRQLFRDKRLPDLLPLGDTHD
ncbi:hypothetical protein [Actinosynnema sp. NPDC020468]|uniref:hypothetical protein n=1 Tax=Actinosynnema sp. NPDC020468 TaxID=3154488 RepID=UPI0033F1F5D6